MDCKLCGKDLKEERRQHFVRSVSTSTKIAIDSALWHEGRGYLEFFYFADGWICMYAGETDKERNDQNNAVLVVLSHSR